MGKDDEDNEFKIEEYEDNEEDKDDKDDAGAFCAANAAGRGSAIPYLSGDVASGDPKIRRSK